MIYFVSDAHIGSKAITRGWAHQKKFIQLLNKLGEDAVSIYLMGDIFDFWFEYYTKDKSKKEYQPLFRCIRHLVRKGVHVHYFVGNHDMWTWGGLASMTGMEVHFEPNTIRRYGKLLYLAHGDGIVPFDLEHHYPREARAQIRKFMRLRQIFQNEFLQFLFRCLPPAWGNKIGYTWAAKSRQKELDNLCPFKGEKNEELVLFAKEEERLKNHRDYYIFGHRHIELDLQLESGSRVIILGDCFRQWTYASLNKRGELQLHNYDEELQAEKEQQAANPAPVQ
jgi:UDP-2,3-diacylglucosamine hydrolase